MQANQASPFDASRLELALFIRELGHDPDASLSHESHLFITEHLPGPCLHAAFDHLVMAGRQGNPSATALLAAMPSPGAPPGGEC